MVKIELIKNITGKYNVGELEAAIFVDNIFDSMSDAFRKGKNINIPEFGKFTIVNKTINGKRQKYVAFSPVKNLADSVNENYTDLEPQITKIYSLKNNAVLKVREVLPEGFEEDFIYFTFDDKDDFVSSSEIQNVTESIPEQTVDEIILDKDINEDNETKVQTVFKVDNLDEIAALNIDDGQDIFADNSLKVADEKLNSDVKQTHLENLVDKSDSRLLNEQNIFVTEDKIENGIVVHDSEILESPEAVSSAENTEEHVNSEIPPVVFLHKEKIEDEFGEDDIEKDILDLLAKREEILREMNLFDSIPLMHTEPDKDDNEIIFPQEDIVKPFEVSGENELIESINEQVIEPVETFKQETENKTDDSLFSELEKRIKELDELSKKQDEILNHEKAKPQNPELKIFDRLIDDSIVIEELPPEPETLTPKFPDVIVEELREVESEPSSLSDALENIKMDGIFEHLENDVKQDEAKSFDDVFKKNDKQFVPQFTVTEEKHNTQGRFFKIFLYIFFVFLVSAFAFYIYKSLFTNSNSNKVSDTIGLAKIDSVRQMLSKSKSDSLSKTDSSMKKIEKDIKGESIEIKNLNGVVYRELGNMIFIQNKVVDDINEASEIEVKLKLNNLSCRVEAIMTLQNKLEYRVLVGPFETIEKATEYYELNKAVLNFIQIMNPRKTNLLVL